MQRRNLVAPLALAILAATILFANRHIFLPAQAATTTPQGSVVPIPSTFPSSFPIYPGAVFLGAEQGVGRKYDRWYDRGWFATPDDGKSVIDWYRAHLAHAGLEAPSTRRGGRDRFDFGRGRTVLHLDIIADRNVPTMFSVEYETWQEY